MFTRFARQTDLRRSFGPRPRGVGIQSIGMADQYQVEAGMLDQAQVEAGLLDQYQVESGLLDAGLSGIGDMFKNAGSAITGMFTGTPEAAETAYWSWKKQQEEEAKQAAEDAKKAAQDVAETKATVGFFSEIGTSLLGLVGAIAQTDAQRKAIKERERQQNLWGNLPPAPTPPSSGIGGALPVIAIVGAGGVLLYLVFRKKK